MEYQLFIIGSTVSGYSLCCMSIFKQMYRVAAEEHCSPSVVIGHLQHQSLRSGLGFFLWLTWWYGSLAHVLRTGWTKRVEAAEPWLFHFSNLYTLTNTAVNTLHSLWKLLHQEFRQTAGVAADLLPSGRRTKRTATLALYTRLVNVYTGSVKVYTINNTLN